MAVSNVGHTVLPKGQRVTITLIAHNTGTGSNTTLALSPAKPVSLLKVGTSQTFSLPVKFPAGLPAGSYLFNARITPVQALNEASTANNLVTNTSGGGTLAISASPAIYDLTGVLLQSNLKSTATSVVGNVLASVRSIGNVALPAQEQVQLKVIAHWVARWMRLRT